MDEINKPDDTDPDPEIFGETPADKPLKKKGDAKCLKIFGVFLHVVFLVVSSYAIYTISTENSNEKPTDVSRLHRQTTEKRLLKSINFSVNPCTNFYEFVCGNWIQHDTIPNHLFRTSTSTELENLILRKIESYLNKENSEDEPKAVHEARKMYKSCVYSETRNQDAEHEKISSLLRRLYLPLVPNFSKKFKLFSWMLPAIMNKKLLNHNFFFQFAIQPDPYILNKNRIYITNPSNRFYSKFDKYHDLNVRSKSGFFKFIRSIALAMYHKNNKRWTPLIRLTFRHRFSKLFKFARRLEELDSWNEGSYLADYVSIQDLQKITDFIFKKRNPNSKINWEVYLEKMFEGSSVSLNLNRTDRLILIPNKQYISEVLQLLAKTPPHILEFYMWSRTMFVILPYSKSMLLGKYNEYLYKFFGKERPPRDLYCTDLVQRAFYYATPYFIVNDTDMPRKINEISETFKNVRDAFSDEIMNATWLDEITRKKALKKLESMKINIGYPDWMKNPKNIDKYYNLTMDEDDLLQNVLSIKARKFQKMLALYKIENDHEKENPWIGQVLQVNAFYSSFYNSITIPAGLLSYPFYDLGIQAMNYGAIGMIIGHELIHGFDKSGKEFDADGHLNSWWSNQTKIEYEKRANRFISNYDQFVINYVKANKADDIQLYLNGLLTLNENIADHGGLRIAYKAYKNFTKIHGPEELFTKLNFTAEQLFFLAFTHSRCEHISEQMRQLRLTDEHGLNVLRVLTTLSTSSEFSDAWKCDPGSPMNPSADKCKLW
ncbi:neprilysin-1-like isoform X2 [Planococcus citri]|uniref:neprilysin-1-like isoform X2 n=1 Tax=Planococcus citri TaxID=170843 RepID=UPI0031F930D3